MSGTPASIEIQNEKLEAAQQWLHQNGNNVGGIEYTPAVEDAEDGYPAHTMTIRKSQEERRRASRNNMRLDFPASNWSFG